MKKILTRVHQIDTLSFSYKGRFDIEILRKYSTVSGLSSTQVLISEHYDVLRYGTFITCFWESNFEKSY